MISEIGFQYRAHQIKKIQRRCPPYFFIMCTPMKITKVINENAFSMIRWPKKRFFDDPLAKNKCFLNDRCLEKCFLARFLKKVFPSTKNPWKKPSQSIGHQRIQPTEKLSQKAKQSPTKNRYKFQNNNARAASGARPIFGGLLF